jgi:hypothetical protein
MRGSALISIVTHSGPRRAASGSPANWRADSRRRASLVRAT